MGVVDKMYKISHEWLKQGNANLWDLWAAPNGHLFVAAAGRNVLTVDIAEDGWVRVRGARAVAAVAAPVPVPVPVHQQQPQQDGGMYSTLFVSFAVELSPYFFLLYHSPSFIQSLPYTLS